jgi:catechol 2,3-dioxygenase-like lactoylglutathione lyase family enzyme
MHRLLPLAALVLVLAPVRAEAQLTAGAPIVYGHLHLNPTNIPETKKFWADALGGSVIAIGTDKLEVIRFPGALVFWRANQAAKGGSRGSTADHIGFSVPSLAPVLQRVRANGFRVVSAEEAQPTDVVQDGIVTRGAARLAFLMGPDDAKVELVEQPKQALPIQMHHMHLFSHQNREMRDWYAKIFNATPREGSVFVSAVLPGVTMNFSPAMAPAAATAGRVYDHFGFEVKNLEEFCRQLEAQGIKFTVSYRRIAAIDTAIAIFTDPWGTTIELSEGLGKF